MKDSKTIRSLKGKLSLTLILPVSVATELGLEDSDLMEYEIEGHRLMLTKLEQKDFGGYKLG